MVEEANTTPILPAHIEETVKAIARLHDEHYREASPFQRGVDRITRVIGRPEFVGYLSIVVTAWIALNLSAPALGFPVWDTAPFAWLQGATGLMALYVTALILTTQRREDQLATYREQLTLELAILSEQKSAKIIELLEEMRRDSPSLRNRVDQEAEAMSQPADPQSVLDALKNSREDSAGFEDDETAGNTSLLAPSQEQQGN